MRKKITRYIDRNIDKDKFINKNIFITGSNSGIGFELAKECAYLKANVFLLCRNKDRAEAAKQEILKDFPDAKIKFILLDLASFDSIKEAVNQIKQIDVDYFVNNAGVYHIPKTTTKEGLEIVLGTNFIGTLYLSDLLLPYFASLDHKVHVSFESSITSKMYKINYSDFFGDKKYKKMKIYASSKICINNVFYNYLDEYKDSNLVLSLAHPGGVYTPLIKKAYKDKNKLFQYAAYLFMKVFFHRADKAALSTLYSLNKDNTFISGPRGLFEASGYPKKCSFKKNKDYVKCVNLGREIIKNHIKETL